MAAPHSPDEPQAQDQELALPANSTASSPAGLRRLIKRDGREVGFEPARIQAAVQRALEAVGEEDLGFAKDVADVVTLALSARFSTPPNVEQVQDLVEQALVEMGRAQVARAYILYRDRRARARAALTITHHDERAGRMPWVRAGAGTSPWSLARIVAALMEEGDLPRAVSEDVAERVEKRICDAGLARVSTALIREFVDNELMAMGLETALHRQESVGIPRHDLRHLLARARPSPQASAGVDPEAGGPASKGLEDDVADALLARYSLSDLLDERTADLHRKGALWVEGLRRPHLALTRAVPASLCLRGEPSAHSGSELLGELAHYLRGVSHGVVVEGLHAVVSPLLRSARARDRLRDLLATMGALAQATGRSLDLASPGGRGGALLRRLLPEFDVLRQEGRAQPRLFLSWDELSPAIAGDPELELIAARLICAGTLVPVWHAAGARWVAPGCRRGRREVGLLACGGAVALNLPRLARKAGPWREDLLFEALGERIQNALDAIEALDAFQRRFPSAREAEIRERRGFALVPVGLAEALRILGDGVVRPSQGARLLGVLADGTRRFADDRGLSVCVSSFFAGEARRAMARADAALPRASQARLFADLPAPEQEDDRPYSSGFVVAPNAVSDQDPADQAGEQATVCSTLRAGALAPNPLWVSADRELTSVLDAWRRFHDRRSGTPDSDSSHSPLTRSADSASGSRQDEIRDSLFSSGSI